MSKIYLKDVESYGVIEANKDREKLEELNIRSPDVSKMYKLKIDRQTMFYFRDAGQRAIFIDKYYSRRAKGYSFEKKEKLEDEYLLNN